MEFNFSKHRPFSSYVTVIGVGGGASRIANQFQAFNLVNTCAFGMNRKEMEELSLPHKYIIGDGLGSGKDRCLAESECQKVLPCLEDELRDKRFAGFVVCLGGGTGEGCIKTFLQKAEEMATGMKLLFVTLPHSSEGTEKRKNAISLLHELEQYTEGIIVVDYDTIPCSTFSELYKEGDRRMIKIMYEFVRSISVVGVNSFDFWDMFTFLKQCPQTKYIEYTSLSGDPDYMEKAVNDICQFLPPKYSSVYDISSIVVIAEFCEDTSEEDMRNTLARLMKQIPPEVESKVKIDVDTQSRNLIKFNIFTKHF